MSDIYKLGIISEKELKEIEKFNDFLNIDDKYWGDKDKELELYKMENSIINDLESKNLILKEDFNLDYGLKATYQYYRLVNINESFITCEIKKEIAKIKNRLGSNYNYIFLYNSSYFTS